MSRLRDTWALAALGRRVAPGLFATSLALAVAGALASVSYTLGFRITIDAVGRHDGPEVALGVGLIAVLFTLAWTCGTLGASRNSVLTDRVNLELGARIGELVGALPGLEHFERAEDRRRIDQLRANRRALAGAPRQLLRILQVALRALAIVVLLATIYPPILVVPAFALAPALATRMATRMQQRCDDALGEDRRLLGELFALMTDAGSARELRTSGALGWLTGRHTALSETLRRRALRSAVLAAAVEGAGWLIFALGFIAAILVLVLRAAHGHVSPGSVVMSVSLMRRAQSQISRGTDSASSFGGSLATVGQLGWLERHVGEVIRGGRRAPERLADGIRLDGLAFGYPDGGREVLAGIDLHLPAGAIVALVGANGAGKSTLIKLLCGMYRPDRGAIRIDGVELDALDLAAWRARTTATFQDFQRLQLPLHEAVGVGDLPRIDDHDAARAALARAGDGALAERLPEGLRTQLGRAFGGRDLSGGQWQTVALARGLMRTRPLLVVLDEPTAAIDAARERALFDRYAAAARRAAAGTGAVTLLVTHRFSSARTADLIVLLDGGRIVETGTHAELVAAGGSYAQLYELQARGYR